MRRLVHRHSLPTRILHWLSVPVLATMVWSGIAVSGAKAPYTISIGGYTVCTLFSEEFFRTYNFPSPPRAIAWHFTFMWPFVVVGGCYGIWTFASGSWREIVPRRGGLRDAWKVLRHDLKSHRPARAIEGRYNAAQRLAYTIANVLLMFLFVTGLAIYKPTQLAFLVSLLGGYPMARAIHFWLTFALLGFVAIHLIQVFRAGWNTFRAMVIGVEVVDEPEASHVETG